MHLIALLNREIRVTLRKDRTELFICFGIAAVFWFLVKLSQNYETQWNFEFKYILPEHQAFMEKPPVEVRATIGGSGWSLLNFWLFHRKEPLVFDLRALPLSLVEGRLILDRIQSQISESELQVKSINLDYIGLKTGAKGGKLLPIRLDYRVDLLPQFDLSGPIHMDPDSVWVEGPVSILDSLGFWPTDTGRIGPLKAGWKQVVSLAKPQGSPMKIEVEKTTVEIPVEPVVEKTVLFVPVTVVNAPGNFRIFPATITVYCIVGMSAFHQLDASDFKVEADLEGVALKSEHNSVPLSVTCLEKNVKNLRFSPQSVEFFFRMGEEEN